MGARDGVVEAWRFYLYFLRLGATGFGGPIALVGFMQRDLVEERGAAYVLATRALTDVWTFAIAIVSFVVLTRWKVSELWLIAAAGILGLVIGAS